MEVSNGMKMLLTIFQKPLGSTPQRDRQVLEVGNSKQSTKNKQAFR